METTKEEAAPINPIIHAIPEGARVTVFTASGQHFTGTDDTTGEEADKGLFVLYDPVADTRQSGGKANRKIYLLASSIIGFQMYYNVEEEPE